MAEPEDWLELKRKYAEVRCETCHRLGSAHYGAGIRPVAGLYCGAVGMKQFQAPGDVVVPLPGDAPSPVEMRRTLWQNHGHAAHDLYGAPNDMFCKACVVDDYLRAPFLLLVQQYVSMVVPILDVVDFVDDGVDIGDQYGDADGDSEGYRPNAAMKHGTAAKELLEKLERIERGFPHKETSASAT